MMPNIPSRSLRPSAGRRAVVVGAGPVGCMAAQILSGKGYSVSVYEKRPHFVQQGIAGEGRTINLSVSPRGMKVLAAHCDQDELLGMAVAMDGRVVHPLHGRPQQANYGRPAWYNYSLGRNELNLMLMRDAESRVGVRFEFGFRCSDIDLHGKKAFFDAEDGRRVQESYDLLVGADGALSRVRSRLAAEGLLTFHRRELDVRYRELALWPAADQEGFALSAIHVWPRNGYFMVALPNRDGSLRCTLVLPGKGQLDFSRLGTEEAVEQFFRCRFPDAAGILRKSGGSMSRTPVSTISVISCSALTHEDSVLLIGDAAHSVAPFLGQGVNLGLEDCLVLGQLLEKYPDDQGAALSEYGRERKIDGDAASELSLANYVELSRTTPLNESTDAPIVRDRGKVVPESQQELPLPVLVNFFNLSYREALESYQGQSPR
jgi:kynurenine 3-monooxygenase